MNNAICIYHGTCMDGFTAAWVVRKALGADIEFYAATHGDSPPDVTGKDVIMVDFSYKRPVLMEMAKKARSFLILDHHKSAEMDLQVKGSDDEGPQIVRMDTWTNQRWSSYCTSREQDGYENANCNGAIVYALFDMERSGAGIAWDFFIGGEREPFINHVEDRDLWKFQYADTRNICASVFSYPYDFEAWDRFPVALRELAIEGAAIERKHHKDIAELVQKSLRVFVLEDGMLLPVVNLPYTMGSDAGHLMCKQHPSFGCAGYYWDGPDGRTFGLRSLEGGVDVSEVAKMYGGGGHKHAAGFRVPFDHKLATAEHYFKNT